MRAGRSRFPTERGGRGWRSGTLALWLCTVGLVSEVPGADAQTLHPELWGVDNTVTALARSGNTLYVGGAFSRVGPPTGGAVALPKHCANPRKPFPKVTGYVYSIAADGRGGWFLSGNFTAVGGVPRYCLAHVLSDGSVAPWNPNPNYVPYGAGGGLLVSGNTVYVNGGFATISGKSRQYIAALDAETGEALDWDAHSNGLVAPLAIRGNILYVGGLFSQIGGQPRNNIAALNAKTGAATPWNPDANGGAWSVVARGKHVYVGGSFSHIGGQRRSLIAELDSETGLATEWDVSAQGPGAPYPYVAPMLLHGDRLYVGGSFTAIGGQARNGLAAIDLHSGDLTDWDPQPSAAYCLPEISVLRGEGHSLYVGGYFHSIGGKPRNYVAELDARTGAAADWNPDPSNVVFGIAVSESTVCIGGWFKSMGMVPRHNLAAFDLTTGRVTDWNPNPDGVIVYALAVDKGRVYAGGHFLHVGGQARSAIAALDTLTGAATEWNPGANEVVRALAVKGDLVYTGGTFTSIGGQPRRYLAALDATTGAATAWDAASNDYVLALALRDGRLYAGGFFTRMAGQSRYSMAAVDALTGAVLPWSADTDGAVEAIAISGNTVYLGGPFNRVNGENRFYLAAVDAETGDVKPWDPEPGGPREDGFFPSIHALATSGNTVFVGGDFTVIGGQRRASLAALDDVTGAVLDWDPNPDQSVWALEASGDRLFAGGFLQAAQSLPHLALIGVSLPGVSLVRGRPSVLGVRLPHRLATVMAPITPNPVRASAIIRYALATEGPVSLSVYDLQGRCVERVLEHEPQTAGEHELRVNTQHLPTGCYVYRLVAGNVIRTQKAVVMR